MLEATYNFPKEFMWGTATSSHQVEGKNENNNWFVWEQGEGNIENNDVSGDACDWWGGRWKEDLDRAANSGQNAHRLSIEWSRIQPTPDRWDETAIDYYRQIIRGMIEREIKPLVTLHHFTDPIWFSEVGGWENEQSVEFFQKYVDKIVEALGDMVDIFCTINEPNVYAVMGYIFGVFPPGESNLEKALQVMVNLAKAHAAAYYKIHEHYPDSMVGIANHWRGFHSGNRFNPLENFVVNVFDKVFNGFFPNASQTGELNLITKKQFDSKLKGTQDFIGLNYYTSDWVNIDLKAKQDFYLKRFFPDELELSPTGFIANYSDDFMRAMKWANSFGLPIIVTENGTEDNVDDYRRNYLVDHIHKLWRGVNFNYPILGYMHWSLVDNFEWERGWGQKFGLWELDVDTQFRKKRPSADLYSEISNQNGLSSEIVRKFAPDRLEKLFPG